MTVYEGTHLDAHTHTDTGKIKGTVSSRPRVEVAIVQLVALATLVDLGTLGAHAELVALATVIVSSLHC
jgi:hypothetical protein